MYEVIIILLIIILLSISIFYLKNISLNSCKKPLFLPHNWNNTDTQKYNNCYSYAILDLDKSRDHKLYPGEKSGLDRVQHKKHKYKCPVFDKRLKLDNPGLLDSTPYDDCPCNYYKVGMFLDIRDKQKDFHFYRQDKNGTWSHKPGSNLVTQLDASGEKIKDPLTANRNYSKVKKDGYNYTEPCGFYCMPYKKVKRS
jgi:hypothetical protein